MERLHFRMALFSIMGSLESCGVIALVLSPKRCRSFYESNSVVRAPARPVQDGQKKTFYVINYGEVENAKPQSLLLSFQAQL
ncbi:hypothetical protein T4A_6173 [Trichinella pseudospiralis]|uniref:Uncharacterized protein n=1 Tax=Trichinella pseudospiralis TaxID=6337 RepID=A0A0V1DZI7_TRIPS|nr:hypothetical protein T4A_6173 [Trichinella pseudospiralis]